MVERLAVAQDAPDRNRSVAPTIRYSYLNRVRNVQIARHRNHCQSGVYTLSIHVEEEMAKRGISFEAVEQTLTFGRYKRTRGAKIFAIGRKEVEFYMDLGFDLRAYENTHVVCSNDVVITSYKNQSFKDMRFYKSGKHRVIAKHK